MSVNRDPVTITRVQTFVAFSAWLPMVVGATGLLGWLFHLPVLKTILPGQTTMKANTCIAFVLVGISLWLQTRNQGMPLDRSVRRRAQVFAGVAATIGLLSLSEMLFGWDLGIDQLLFVPTVEEAAGSIRPGLMSPVTAVAFVLSGCALLVLGEATNRAAWLTQSLAAATAIVSAFGLMDLLAAELISGRGAHTHIAPQTALTLLVFSCGLLCARTDDGVGALLVSGGSGGALLRRLLPAAVIIPILIAWAGLKGFETGFYSEWVVVALMTVVGSTLLASAIVWNALLTDGTDKERKRIEDELRSASLYARSLIEASLDPLVTISADGKITDVNQATEQATGVPRAQLIGSDFSGYFTEPEKAKQGYQEVLASGFVRDYALTLRHVSGQVTDVAYNASVFKNEEGQVQGVFAAARDVTERRKAEQESAELSRQNALILESVGEGIYGIDMEGRCTFVNPAATQMLGFSAEELQGQASHRMFHHTRPDGRPYPAEECPVQAAYKQGAVHRGADLYWRKDGSSFPVEFVSTPVREAGRIAGAVVTFRDITERQRAEKEARSSALYARSLIESSLDPLVTISADGKITDVNRATEQATGVPRTQLIGSDFSSYFTEPEKAKQGYQEVLASGFVRDYPLSLRHASGEIIDVVYNASVFKNEEGQVQGVFAAARDITDRKRLERQIQERSDNLMRVITETQEAVRVLTSSASEILATVSELATSATEAASAVSETTTTVEEVKQTAQLSSQKAKEIADSSQSAARVLQTGQQNVEAAVAEMNRIREQTDSIAETIVTLSEQSQAIGEITGSVNELAEQSNLLAVNAAIEAAKAGEQGKGFSVVAQEIRSLAEQSKQATSQVRGLLAEVQKAIGNAVMATEQASKVVETGVKQSHEAGQSIRTAVEATVNVAKISTQISVSSQQQLVGVDQVAIAMESINQASRQIAESMKQVEAVAQNLHGLSQKLKQTVEQHQG